MTNINFSKGALEMNELILKELALDRLKSMDERLLPALRKFSNSKPKVVPDAIKNNTDGCVKAAEQGDVEAMFILGLTYFFGKAMRHSPVRALEHYLLCFKHGEEMISKRSEEADDLMKAVKYFEAASNFDYDHADYMLYEHYLKEFSIAQEKALNYCTKSAKNGLAAAQCYLATHWQFGTLVSSKQPERAFYWCKEAAAHDFYAPGQHQLGVYYEDGVGTEVDLKKAKRMYDLAKENGYNQDSKSH
jgi:TPR repeat protein